MRTLFWIGILGGLGAFLTAGTPADSPRVAPAGRDVFTLATGTWDWEGAEGYCDTDPHTISFSPDRSRMCLRPRTPSTDSAGVVDSVWTYEVRGHGQSCIRAFLLNEDRRTESGELVVWDLVLMGPHEYRWHRADWKAGGYTKANYRCPEDPATQPEPSCPASGRGSAP